MDASVGPELPVIDPSNQIAFHYRLQAMHDLYLSEALGQTVVEVTAPAIDRELAAMVSHEHLTRISATGLRGERFFPVPCVLIANPYLLGYYRLLYGVSRKFFYDQGSFGSFRAMEERGVIRSVVAPRIALLCRSLIGTGQLLVESLDNLSFSVIRDLQVMTVGAMVRGGQNNTIGQAAAAEFYTLVKGIVQPHIRAESPGTLVLENAAGRTIIIQVANDPDVRVTETLASGPRPVLSIEIKGGRDVSNVYNRMGETEKSHLTARAKGYTTFWTILQVDIASDRLRMKTPTTTAFFNLERIRDTNSEEHGSFRELFTSMLGLQ